MHSYFGFFPAKTKTELRTATFSDEEVESESQIPNGTYLFGEFFCTDLKCHCQRVLVKVHRMTSPDARPEEVATISYTWNKKGADRTWTAVNHDMPNPFLDPFHPRTSYAPELLEFWNDMIQRDPLYQERIKRHYDELRAAFASIQGKPVPVGATVLSKSDRRERQRKLEQVKRGRKAR